MRYRHLRRTTIAVLATVAILLAALLLVGRVLSDRRVRAAAARWLETQVHAVTGVRVAVADLDWQLLPPEVVLRGVDVEAPGGRLTVERLAVDVRSLRIARRTLELGTVAAEGVHLAVDASQLPRREGTGHPWLHVVVHHLELERLDLAGHGLPGDVALAVHDLEMAWSAESGPPRGFVRAGHVAVQVPGVEPLEGALAARFVVADGLRVPFVRFTGSGATLAGTLRLADGGRLTADLEGPLELAELDRVLHVGRVLEGRVETRILLDSGAPRPLHARIAGAAVRAAGFPLAGVRGTMTVGRDGIDGTLEEARFHDGRVHGTYHLASLHPPFPHRVHARFDGVTLAAFLADLRVPAAGLAARIGATIDLSWDGRHITRGEGHGEAVLTPAAGRLPAAGPVRCELQRDGLLHFAGDNLAVGGSTVQWEGPLTMGSWQPSWSVAANPARLGELVSLVNGWVGSTVLPPELSGDGEVHLSLAGPWHHLRLAGRVEARDLSYPPMRADRLTAELLIDGSHLTLGPAAFRMGDGDGELAGTVDWGPEAGDEQLDLTMHGRRIPLSVVTGWLDVPVDVAGTASFAGGLRGPVARPRGSWALGLVGAGVAGLRLGDASATVDLGDGVFTAKGLTFSGGLTGSARWDVLGGVLGANLSWPDLSLAPLGAVATRLLGARGDVTVAVRWPLAGAPTGEASLQTSHATVAVRGDEREVTVHGELPGLGLLDADLGRDGGGLAGDGSVAVTSMGELVERVLPGRGVPLAGSGRLAVHLDWPADTRPRLDGHVEELHLTLGGRPVTLRGPAAFGVGPDGLRLDELHLGVGSDEVEAGLAVAADGGLVGRLAGTLDALLLRLVIPEWETAGRLAGEVKLSGTAARPVLDGTVQVTDGSFRLPGGREVVSGITGGARLAADGVELDDVTFRFMHGSARAAGRVGLNESAVDLDLSGTVADLQYPLFPGLVPHLSGSWRLRGPSDALALAGTLTVDRAVLRRKDDLATILSDWFGATPGGAATAPALDLQLRADRSIEARTPFIHVVGSATLQVTGTPAAPGVVGQLELLEGGDFTFQGVRYELDRAVITFSDPDRIEPYIEVRARAWVQIYEVTVTLTGTFDRLVPAFASDPPLPEGEIVSLLAMGRLPEGKDSSGTLGVGLASTLLTREINAELEKRARSLLAVDQVRVDPFAEVSTGNPAARVTVVKQLSPTWTVVLQSNLSSNREEVVTSRWLLGPGLFLEAQRDVDGTYGLDLKVRRRY